MKRIRKALSDTWWWLLECLFVFVIAHASATTRKRKGKDQ